MNDHCPLDCPLDDPTDCPKDGYEKMAKKRTLSIHIKKAVLYVRVSTHWQIDKDSLPVQRKELEYYCRYVLGIDDFVILEDAGYSAKNTDRPAYFVITKELMSKRSISYETLLKAVDSKTIKLFVNLTVQNFCILDGKIASITFKSGIIHKFLYKAAQ